MTERSFPRHRLARAWQPRHVRYSHLPRFVASVTYLFRYYALGYSEPTPGRHHRAAVRPIRAEKRLASAEAA